MNDQSSVFSISYQAFTKMIKKIEVMDNNMPDYIPTAEEIDELIKLSQTPRPKDKKYMALKKTGRIGKYEDKQAFVKPSDTDDTVLSPGNVFAYLTYISETAKPEKGNNEQIDRLNYLNKFLRENMVVNN